MHYSKTVIGNELIQLNQSVLGQAARRTSGLIGDAFRLGDELSYDSRIVEGMASRDKSEGFSDYVEARVNSTIWKDYQMGSAFQLYFCSMENWKFPKTSTYEFETLDQMYKGAKDVDRNGAILLGHDFNEKEKGLYRYTFQIIQEVRDLVTGETYGYLLIKISEKELWETYMELDGDDQRFYVLDQEGTIISSKDKREIGNAMTDLQNSEAMYLRERIRGTDWYLLEEVQIQEVWKSLNRVNHMIALGIVGGVAIFLLLFIYYSGKTLKPVREIEEKMSMAASGNFGIRAEVMQEDEFGQIATSFNTMVEKIDTQVNEIREMEKKKRLAELDFLRAQINPHFIYNTLSSIRFYVEMNQGEKAENMLLNFSKILRKTLTRSEEIVLLREELEAMEAYVELQKMRYTDQLQVTYELAKETMECLIPNFIVQPIIENAIFYSVGNDEAAQISILSFTEGDTLILEVKDNGSGMTQEKIDQVLHKELNINKVGVRNVKERIQLIYGQRYGLWIDSNPGQGTSVRLILPIEWSEGTGEKGAHENTDC